MEIEMGLEQKVESGKVSKKSDYLPFGIQYLEAPKPIGYKSTNFLGYTSVTFSTWKLIPLIDDAD